MSRAGWMGAALARRAGDDPLGTVPQDPDQVRQRACSIAEPNQALCATSTPKPPAVHRADLPWLSWLIWALVLAALVVLVVMIVRSVLAAGRRPRRAKRPKRSPDSDEIEIGVVAVDRSREPVDWRAEAEAHRRAGRHRDALRCRYRALVGDLARRGLIDEIPGRTTGEERSQLRDVLPAAAPAFDDAADLFDAAWYGNAEVDAADDEQFRRLEEQVLAVGLAAGSGPK